MLCDPPALPHQRQIPQRIDDGAFQQMFNTVEESYRKEYFKATNSFTGDMVNRFQQQDFQLLKKLSIYIWIV